MSDHLVAPQTLDQSLHDSSTALEMPLPNVPPAVARALSRRSFLNRVGGITAAVFAAGALGLEPLMRDGSLVQAAEVGPLTASQRRDQAYTIRLAAATYQREQILPAHPDNGDEDTYPNKLASYSKGLPHTAQGEVDLVAHAALINALASGSPPDFAAIPLGGTVKLTDPQAALAYGLEGSDSHHLGMPVVPPFSSPQAAGEMVELYWQALARDVPFASYDSNPLIQRAAANLSQLTDFRGPTVGGHVTPATIFRGNLAGDLSGPYLSQFLWQDIPYGLGGLLNDGPALTIAQRYRVPVANDDFLLTYTDWFDDQRGVLTTRRNTFDTIHRYIRNGRDLGEYVHRDFPYQAFLNACLILLALGAPLASTTPYRNSATQLGFSTFGAPDILDLVTRVTNEALRAAWYQKWAVHRRLRPEAYGGRLHRHNLGISTYPIHTDVLNSPVLADVFAYNRSKSGIGTYLLPQAFPEGAPTHPAYPSGHATYAGAAATVLKSLFDETWPLPLGSLKIPSADGTALTSYTPPTGTVLTVGGELNKLVSNIAIGRDWAGVHYRSDAVEGIRLGEAVAQRMLRDRERLYNQAVRGTFSGFALPARIDGGVELLDQPWHLEGNNGASEAYQSVQPTILHGKTLLRITYDLHGLVPLGNDASAVIFDQGDWRYISLSTYGRTGVDGQQIIEIPLADFQGLDLSTNVGTLHTRFWYSSRFTVDILSIVVY